MTCDACRDLGVNVAALPDAVDPKMTLRDAMGLYGKCPVCMEVVSAAGTAETRYEQQKGGETTET